MTQKNCLIVLRNKKIIGFEDIKSLLAKFSSNSIYFDHIEFCAYDDSAEITRSLRDFKGSYQNSIIFCPSSMTDAVKSFIEALFENRFDNFGVMSGVQNVFILTSDGSGKLTDDDIISIFKRNGLCVRGRSIVKTVGASADFINSVFAKAKEICPDCDFNVREHYSDCTIEISYPESVSKIQYDSMYRLIVRELNDYIYALDDISLAERLYQALKLRRMKISVAESFTGGGVSKRLVEVPGISEVFFEGLNTYSNESKIKRLGVDEFTLKQHGAVSEETAYQMAEGLLITKNCDIAIATTGIAGPKSDSTLKPVGLLYISVGTQEKISVHEYRLQGSRKKITETAINLALFNAFKLLK